MRAYLVLGLADGLFAEDVDAAPQALDRVLVVQRRWAADDDGLEAGVLDHVLEGRVDLDSVRHELLLGPVQVRLGR